MRTWILLVVYMFPASYKAILHLFLVLHISFGHSGAVLVEHTDDTVLRHTPIVPLSRCSFLRSVLLFTYHMSCSRERILISYNTCNVYPFKRLVSRVITYYSLFYLHYSELRLCTSVFCMVFNVMAFDDGP